MATYYAEAADGRSTFFTSRAETPAGIVRAACRALGTDYAAAAWHLAAEVVDGLRSVGLAASQAEACAVARVEGLEIWGTVCRGLETRRKVRPLTLDYDLNCVY